MNKIENSFWNGKKQEVMVLLTYALLIYGLYSSTITSYFVMDDFWMINLGIIEKWQDIVHFFTSVEGWLFYRPLIKITFWLSYLLFGLNPTPYHIITLGFHFLNTVLVFYVCNLLTKQKLVSGIAALFFTIQPLHTEALAHISGINELLWTFFSLLVVYFFARFLSLEGAKGSPYFIASILFFVLSLLSKETAVIIPLFLILYEILKNCENQITSKIGISILRKYIPFLAIVLLYFVLRQFILKPGTYEYHFQLYHFLAVGYKFLQLFAPFKHKDLIHGDLFHLILNLILILNILILISISLIFSKKTLESIKRLKHLIIILLFWITIISWPLYFHSGDRFLYAASVGSSILLSALIVATFRNLNEYNSRRGRVFLIFITMSIVICFSIRTFERMQLYNKVASISKDIIFQIKEKYYNFPSSSNLYFINFQNEWITDGEGFTRIPYLRHTMQVIYHSKSLNVYERHKLFSNNDKFQFLEGSLFFKNIKEGKPSYVFEYKDGVILDRTDIFTSHNNKQKG